jgi:hypothetical protein
MLVVIFGRVIGAVGKTSVQHTSDMVGNCIGSLDIFSAGTGTCESLKFIFTGK